jgi:RNA polymerase sigma-70 factor (ECF subfamily)
MTAPYPLRRTLAPLLAAARGGDPAAVGRLLDACRGYLLWLAAHRRPDGLDAKVGHSDFVQEALAKAVPAFPDFRGDTPAELLAWLRAVLRRTIADQRWRYQARAKRRLGRELSLQDSGHTALRQQSVSDMTPPAAKVERAEAEAAFDRALFAAVERLPAASRQVFELRHRYGRPFADIAADLGRTEVAVRKAWVRALKRLRRTLEPPP